MTMRFSWALFGAITLATAKPLQPRSNDINGTMAWSFADVPSSAVLQWTPCFQNYSCANLEVPLDYDKPDVGTINVAFLKKNAPQQPAMGDIIFNPGGPGGSGVDFVLHQLDTLTPLLGDKYNIVGMDPRGVNNSGPAIDCFPGKPAVRDYFNAQYFSNLYVGSNSSLVNHFQAAGAFGDWCSKTLGPEANYANTPATARDMLQYAEALAESQGKPKEEAKLDYYGVSYGSTLGTTFASLYPDRVGRMIIDGVVDVEDHYSGAWKRNTLLADDAVRYFFQSCYDAGTACAFFRNDTSPQAIEKRFNAVLDDVKESPIPISDPSLVDFPTTVTYETLAGVLLILIYDAIHAFPLLATLWVQLEARKADLIVPLSVSLGTPIGKMPKTSCDFDGPLYSEVQPRMIVACNDAHGRYNISTVEEWQQYIDDQKQTSAYVGEVWATVVTLQCRTLPFKPPVTQQFPGFNSTTATSNPILFTTNRIDPVASSAHKMSKFFPSSVVLTQDAVGHGLMVASSECISGYLQKFLESGELPPANTTCKTENKPWSQ